MTPSAHLPHAVAESARYRTERAETIKRAWQVDQRPDAAAALDANPDIAADRAVALDLAYEEFCAREEAGETLDADTFCAQFSFGASLRRLLTVHQFLDAHPDALGGVPAAWPAAGDPVGDFLVLRELGRGSFARVYLAVETTAGDRPVVIKVSAAGSREADTLGPLAHPHLVPVLSCRTVGAWTVVAMPFAGTASLEDALEAVWHSGHGAPPQTAAVLLDAAGRGGLPGDPPFPARVAPVINEKMAFGDAVAALAVGLFSAVAYLHEQGVVHHDIKPSNVLFGPGGHPYLLDFNLASRGSDPCRLVGTLPYMAPEHLTLFADPGGRPDGRPGDVFACGVVLFELLTGKHPFGRTRLAAGSVSPQHDRGAAALLAAQRAGHPELTALNPTVRRDISDAVRRCLALKPELRPTAAELVALLARTEKHPWRVRVPALVGAGVLALGLGYAVQRALAPAAGADAGSSIVAPVPPAEPAPPDTPFKRGLLFVSQKEYGLAAVEFKKAGEADRDGRAYEYLAFCLSHGKAPEGAVFAANEAIRLDHRTAAVYANRAYNHFKDAKFQAAKEDCDEALRRDPGLVAARFTRACTQLQMHFQSQTQKAASTPLPAQAVEDIDFVTAAVPNDPDVWATAAQLYVLASNGRPEMLDRAALAVRSAVLAGKAPAPLGRNSAFKPLAGHSVFKDALKLAPGRAPVANHHIAKPVS